MMNKLRIGAAAGLVLGLSTLLVGCQDPSPDKASLKYSQDLYDGCVQCHGENGEGNQAVGAPAIAGLQRWYVKRQLRGFKAGYRGSTLRPVSSATGRTRAATSTSRAPRWQARATGT